MIEEMSVLEYIDLTVPCKRIRTTVSEYNQSFNVLLEVIFDGRSNISNICALV